MINAKHYCRFVKVNGPLSPVSAPTSELQVSPLIVSAALSWRLRVTPPRVGPRDAPGSFARGLLRCWAAFFSSRSRSLTPLPHCPSCGFPKNTRNRQRYARLTVCYYRCAALCVHAESGSSFNLPQCMTALHTQAAHPGTLFS